MTLSACDTCDSDASTVGQRDESDPPPIASGGTAADCNSCGAALWTVELVSMSLGTLSFDAARTQMFLLISISHPVNYIVNYRFKLKTARTVC